MFIYFATTSNVKFNQYSEIFRDLGIELKIGSVIDRAIEPQFDDSIKERERLLIEHPLRRASRILRVKTEVPYMIEDTMLVINAFSSKNAGGSGLPGADTKSWWRNLRSEGILKLLGDERERRASFICQIGLYIGEELSEQYNKPKHIYLRSELLGTITKKIRESDRAKAEVPRSNPFYFHTIFQPEGCHFSLAEMSGEDFAKVDYRRKCAEQVAAIIKEFDFTRIKIRELELPDIKQPLLPFEKIEIRQLALPFDNQEVIEK